MARIIETTIRDGSYEVGFHFTRADVAALAGVLDQAGFSYIEVGHGSGLGGEVFGEEAAANDQEYLEAARRAVKRAQLGALLGFTKRSEEEIFGKVRLAANVGLDFLRMGFIPSRSDSPVIVKSIDLAKQLGLLVSANFMRIYCAPREEITERCRRLLEHGVDWFYVVDSAGGMTPAQVREYVEAFREAGAQNIGFHGHNNTQGALTNSIAALEAGASLLDTSLQGLGRATGNAQTEVLLTVLQQRYGYEKEIDSAAVNQLARNYVQPLLRPGIEPTYVLSGALNVHSSALAHVEQCAREYGVDPDAVLALAGVRAGEAKALDTRNLPDEIVRAACEELAAKDQSRTYDVRAVAEHCREYESGPPKDLAGLIAWLKVLTRRDHLDCGLMLVSSTHWPYEDMGVVHRQGWALGVIPIESPAELELSQYLPLDCVRHIFVDDRLPEAAGLTDLAPVTKISFVDALAEAALATDALRLPTLVAVEDEALKAAVLGRLTGCKELVVLEQSGQPVGPARYGHIIAEGRLGAELLDGEAFRAELTLESTVTLLGRTSLSPRALQALRERGARVRLPDPFPLLLARLAMCDRVRLVGDGRDALDSALQRAGASESIVWHGQVVEPQQGSRLGALKLLPDQAAEERAARWGEVASAFHEARLRRLLG